MSNVLLAIGIGLIVFAIVVSLLVHTIAAGTVLVFLVGLICVFIGMVRGSRPLP